MRPIIPKLLLMVALSWMTPPPCTAHTLPISYLNVVLDTNYIHLELTINPYELAFFRQMDANQNARLDSDELERHERDLADALLSRVKLSIGNSPLTAETSGVARNFDGHHMTVRAHYRTDARNKPLTIESSLPAATGSSHLTQIVLVWNDEKKLAQLDAQSGKVTFPPFEPPVSFSPPPSPPHPRRVLSLAVWTALLALIASVLLIGLLWLAHKWRSSI